jgi:uncharacterized membrane protein (DUF2068 family)
MEFTRVYMVISHHGTFRCSFAVDEIQRSLLSVCSTCLHYDITSATEHSAHEICIIKLFTNMTSHTTSLISAINVELWLIRLWTSHFSIMSRALKVHVSPYKTISVPCIRKVQLMVSMSSMQFYFSSELFKKRFIHYSYDCLIDCACCWSAAVTQVYQWDVTILTRGGHTWRQVCSYPSLLEMLRLVNALWYSYKHSAEQWLFSMPIACFHMAWHIRARLTSDILLWPFKVPGLFENCSVYLSPVWKHHTHVLTSITTPVKKILHVAAELSFRYKLETFLLHMKPNIFGPS